MAVAILWKYHPTIIGITGSVGKSSTKEAIALVLTHSFSVRAADGNYNNEIGIPLTIIGARSGGRSVFRWFGVLFRWTMLMIFPMRYPEMLVLEMGVDHPGDMGYLLSFIPVKVGVATQVATSHLANFGSIASIAKEKGGLITSLPQDGFAIINSDDARVRKMGERTAAKVITYGFEPGADVRADNIIFYSEAKRIEGFSFKLDFEGKSVPVRLPKVVARHHIPAVLAAVAVGLAFRMNLVDIASALEEFEPLPGRLRLLPGRSDMVLLDDTYNASPVSVRAALGVLGELSAPRKIAVLGDMLELGPETEKEHADLEGAVIGSGAHFVILVGKHMRALHDTLLSSGYARKQLLWMPDPVAASEALLRLVRSEDLILIKGSRGMRMEKATEALFVDPTEAKNFLCCQSNEWKTMPFAPPAEWVE
jgi:UDP-N-acetylmuramoyl-tripeptide--D-alanyl-D-alanine ligase